MAKVVVEYELPYYSLKSMMSQKGFVQKDVADSIGIDRSTFNSKLNRSNGRDFTLSETYAISRLLNVKIDDFFKD